MLQLNSHWRYGGAVMYLWVTFCYISMHDFWRLTIEEYHDWWRHQMEIFSALLALCAGNLPVTNKFPAQRPVTWSFDVFFDRRLNKWLSKQPWGWWFETPSWSLWHHCNDILNNSNKILLYVMRVKNTLIWRKEFQFGENKLTNFG